MGLTTVTVLPASSLTVTAPELSAARPVGAGDAFVAGYVAGGRATLT